MLSIPSFYSLISPPWFITTALDYFLIHFYPSINNNYNIRFVIANKKCHKFIKKFIYIKLKVTICPVIKYSILLLASNVKINFFSFFFFLAKILARDPWLDFLKPLLRSLLLTDLILECTLSPTPRYEYAYQLVYSKKLTLLCNAE